MKFKQHLVPKNKNISKSRLFHSILTQHRRIEAKTLFLV
jgi:hypothetical protein